MPGGVRSDDHAPIIAGTRVGRFAPVLHIVPDLDAARSLYGDVLGLEHGEPVDVPEERVRTIRFNVGRGPFDTGEGEPDIEAVEIVDPARMLDGIARVWVPA